MGMGMGIACDGLEEFNQVGAVGQIEEGVEEETIRRALAYVCISRKPADAL